MPTVSSRKQAGGSSMLTGKMSRELAGSDRKHACSSPFPRSRMPASIEKFIKASCLSACSSSVNPSSSRTATKGGVEWIKFVRLIYKSTKLDQSNTATTPQGCHRSSDTKRSRQMLNQLEQLIPYYCYQSVLSKCCDCCRC